jgi:hypothetical protein
MAEKCGKNGARQGVTLCKNRDNFTPLFSQW